MPFRAISLVRMAVFSQVARVHVCQNVVKMLNYSLSVNDVSQ